MAAAGDIVRSDHIERSNEVDREESKSLTNDSSISINVKRPAVSIGRILSNRKSESTDHPVKPRTPPFSRSDSTDILPTAASS
jgi:hypothetical protein